MKKRQFIIQGMHCVSCVGTVERALNKVEGVTSAVVNFASETATVEGDKVAISSLVSAVDKVGYKLIARQETNSGHTEHKNGSDHATRLKDREIKKLRSKLVIGAGLSVVILSLSLLPVSSVGLGLIPKYLLIAILTTPVQFWVGYQFLIGAFKALKNFRANMDTLVALGTSAAFWFSLVEVILMASGSGIGLGIYFDAVAVVTTLVILGKYLEARAKGSASEAIKQLLKLQAKTAHIVQDDQVIDVSIDKVKYGDVLEVKPGEKVPVDGVIISGQSSIDESMVTGESMPIDKKNGEKVIGSTINKTGNFRFRALAVGKETFLEQMVKSVEVAQGSKAPIQRLADKITVIFVPIVLAVSLATFVIWLIFGPVPVLNLALVNAVAVLVVACPCALGLATPTAIMVGSGKASQSGIIIREASALELAGKTNTVVLDKTGTITKGKPQVTDILGSQIKTESEVLKIAASLEAKSEHPLARAVVARAKQDNIDLKEVSSFRVIEGKGVVAEISEQIFYLGNQALLDDHGISTEGVQADLLKLESQAKTILILADDKQTLGIIAVADALKPTASKAVELLKGLGLEIYLLTGDNQVTARAIASEVGIGEEFVIAKVLPSDKARIIKILQGQVKPNKEEIEKWGVEVTEPHHKVVAMVGDGINDAPALVQADIGLAIGTGTDIAIESAKITLVSGDPLGIYKAIKISRSTLSNIKQNLFWAYFYNIVLIPIAAGVLWPSFRILLNPMLAGGAMAFSSVSVVLNSLRLKNTNLEPTHLSDRKHI